MDVLAPHPMEGVMTHFKLSTENVLFVDFLSYQTCWPLKPMTELYGLLAFVLSLDKNMYCYCR